MEEESWEPPRSRGRQSRGLGWLTTLFGGAALVAVGFALGLVVGAVREEPGIVVRHISGQTQEARLPQQELQPPAAAPANGANGASGAHEGGGEFDAGDPEEGSPAEPAPLGAPQRVSLPQGGAPAGGAGHAAGGAAAPAPAAPLAAPPPTPPAVAAPPPVETARVAPPVSARPPSAAGFAVQVGAFRDGPQAEKLASRLRSKGFRVYVAPGDASPDSRWRVRVGPVPTREEADRLAAKLKSGEKLPTWVLDAAR
jgi:DedD protein